MLFLERVGMANLSRSGEFMGRYKEIGGIVEILRDIGIDVSLLGFYEPVNTVVGPYNRFRLFAQLEAGITILLAPLAIHAQV